MKEWFLYLLYDEGGFLGFGGGDRKKSYQTVQQDARNMRQSILGYAPSYTSNRLGINAYQNAQNNENPNFPKISSGWNSLIDNSPTQGYTPEELNAMRKQSADITTGGRVRATQGINRNIAAQGMGNTGAGIRSLQALEPSWTQASLQAQNNTDVAAADARRADQWKAISAKMDALQGLNTYEQGRESFNRNAFNDERSALNDETGLFNTAIGTYGPELGALQGEYRPGNWSYLGKSMIDAMTGKLMRG